MNDPIRPRITPFDIQRRVVAHKTTESWETIPHAGMVIELDVTEVCSLVERLRNTAAFDGVRVTLNSMMLKIIAEGIKKSPDINATMQYNKRSNAGALTYRDSIDIAVPLIAADNRMITPILRNVGESSLREVCQAMDTLKKRARNTQVDLLLLEAGLNDTWERLRRGQLTTILRRLWANFVGAGRLRLPSRAARRAYQAILASERLTAADLLDATTLVSNVGSVMPELEMHGVLLEIIPPQLTAMVLAGVRKAPKVVTDEHGNDTIAIRRMMPLTFYLDHRALDFEHVTGFLRRLMELCAHPELLLGE